MNNRNVDYILIDGVIHGFHEEQVFDDHKEQEKTMEELELLELETYTLNHST